MTRGSAPLGRYGHEGGALVEIRLVDMPLRIWQRSTDHHDELMRELSLLALAPSSSRSDLPARLVELVDVLGRQYGAATARPDAERDAALARGLDRMDLVYTVPATVGVDARRLGDLMAECEDYCRSEQLLTMPQPPVQVAFARWYLQEFETQAAGGDPTPWPGPWD